MAIYTINESQRKAAKVVGFTYLFTVATGRSRTASRIP
jgi:hypothetical protein